MRTLLSRGIFLPILFTIPLLVCIGGMRTPNLKKLLELRQHVHHVALFETKHKAVDKCKVITSYKEVHDQKIPYHDLPLVGGLTSAFTAPFDEHYNSSSAFAHLPPRAPPTFNTPLFI